MSMLDAVFADPLNFAFCSGIFGIFALCIVGALRQRGVLGRVALIGPGLLTGLGVLGTFVGIFQGLLGFDVRDISGSVPLLLDGMKTAFATSVAGMLCGLLVKVANEVRPPQAGLREDVGAAELLQALQALRADTNARLDSVARAVSGEGDGSLVTQLQKLRTGLADQVAAQSKASLAKFDEVLAEMRAISTRLAEDNAKAFIAALETAIRDFNTKLTEQFGQNFKELNEAVGRLLAWQQAYRQQMEDMATHLAASTDAARESAGALTVVAARSQSILQACSALADLLRGYEAAREELERHLAAFAELGASASQAMPLVERRLAELTEGFGTAVQSATAEVGRSLEQQAASFVALRQGFEGLRQSQENSSAALARVAEEIFHKATGSVERIATSAATQLDSAIRATNDQLATRLEEQGRRTRDALEKQVLDLDKALQDELTRTLRFMGERLAAVSNHLMEDYTALASRLRQIAQVAQRA